MGRGRFKAKPTGRRNFSTPEEMGDALYCWLLCSSSHLQTGPFYSVLVSKKKGILDISEIQNPNLVKPKNLKARAADVESTPELSRREREEIEKQKAHERYMRLQEQGKTEQARKDLERLALIRQQRAEASKKREEEKAAKEQKKAEARK
ncbi:hypothetical protein ZIOFF_019238 [Zingiber officinale]|uniref:Casein kinase substrate phosphoprotein PP28 domain-containing protein n=1 Tax=Zingiber officinale TaxID=94328 RepID=A0A8J5LMR8_ZINOF|nr:hypothetical protein ZIOFF_019238 [Zingiber officinale]